jgi:NAD(P)-dependent dehydrogenase (short-subunit alcohol dehydrogenase family)
VNCAGNSEVAPVVSLTPEAWQRMVAVQLHGTFYCLQAAARNMLAHDVSGTIVNISSINARFGHRGLSAYSAAKAGVSMLTVVAALELAQAGIRVNAVAPGIVESGMTAEVLQDAPSRRSGHRDPARSDAAGGHRRRRPLPVRRRAAGTGQVLSVDGEAASVWNRRCSPTSLERRRMAPGAEPRP